jgi:glycerol-3-phosphate acyltransferase PlsX
VKIIVDGFGGDNAPLEILKGAADAVAEYGVSVLMTGDKEALRRCAKENDIALDGIEIVHASDVLSMEDNPLMLMKEKKNSSIAVAFDLLQSGQGNALVSAGNTGALVVGGNLIIRTVPGIKRAAIATVMPTNKEPVMVLDSGANMVCSPESFVQFGVMGSAYMNRIMGVANPRVGLANIGTERIKGTKLQTEAYDLMETSGLNFVGNAEVRDIPFGFCDVVVADGFTGNVILKMYEGVAGALMQNIKAVFMQNMLTKLSALLVKDGLKGLKSKMDYSEYGGAPLLGLKKCVIKAHGSSDAKSLKNAIRQATTFVERDVIEEISQNLPASRS